jgi:GTPase SAR1 family protein
MGSMFVDSLSSPHSVESSGSNLRDRPDVDTMAPSIDAALETQDLANEQRGLLELVDKLQFAQLDSVKLPQIVVVGDQSAGKSSVLEAITGTPFPRDAGACTRFATEIRLRRSPEASLTVTIIPDRNRNLRDQDRLRQFGGAVDANTPFDTLMRLAVDLIAPKNIPGRFAARDILVVEKRGPDMPLLTLVDLPGLVKNANNDQSLEDIKTIESLSDRYMKSSRTIILAVVGGNSDYVQAPILTKARQFDPTGARTIGVLTKPDLTESIGLEDKFLELVQNKDKRNLFRLGWFVLLNPGPREPGQSWPSARERKQREDEFFNQGKWSTLPISMTGTTALKQKLSIQLQRHIGKHVKTLRRQIQKALDDCESELKSLGTGKDTVEEMRIELVELFSSSKELVIPAVYGFYKNPPRKQFFRSTADPRGTPAQNLRARATEENDKFSQRVRMHGRRFTFGNASDPKSSSAGLPFGDGGKKDFVRNEVELLLQQIRGSEFPMDPKPRAVYMLFQSYSEYWPKLAQEHKDNLGVVCNEFLSEVIDFVWPQRMRDPLRAYFLDIQMKKLLSDAQEELEHLTQDMHLEIQPYDPEYEERLRAWHVEATKDGGVYTESQEVLEKMLIYYELSAKSFIRNVITQVVERHLLQGMYGIFNSADILGMQNGTIEAIASENKETRDRRIALKIQKKAIEEAKDLCANLAMRKELRMVSTKSFPADGMTHANTNFQYAEDDREKIEETSDEEGQSKTQSRRPVSAIPPSPSRERRRSTRQPGQESRPEIFAPNGQSYAAVNNGGLPTPRMEAPRSPFEWRDSNRDRDDGEGYYKTTDSAPLQAPPPPPRPEKLRPDLVDAGFPPTPPSAEIQRKSSAEQPGRERERDIAYGALDADYASPSGRRSAAKKLFSRG